jgi:HPt (histidine-containing phosphotransfer) domain-containing protein
MAFIVLPKALREVYQWGVPLSVEPGSASASRLLIVEDHPLNQKVLAGFLAQAGLQAGMDDVITKSILTEELHGALARWLGKAGPERAAAPSPLPRPDWVDLRRFREMDKWIRTYDPRFWERAQDQFRNSYRRLVLAIREAFQSGRLPEAAESAHSLKGLCLMLGLRRMSECCASLEALCAERNAEWASHVSQLESSLEPSLAELRRQVGHA